MVVQSTGSSSFSSSSAAATAAPASQPSVGFFICERAAQDKGSLFNSEKYNSQGCDWVVLFSGKSSQVKFLSPQIQNDPL